MLVQMVEDSVETMAKQGGTLVLLKTMQHVEWSYRLNDADAPACACAPSHLCSYLAQEPCSPSLGTSPSLGLLEHRKIHHSDHSGNTPTSSHQCLPHWEHSEIAG
jgi:hypothetical protein